MQTLKRYNVRYWCIDTSIREVWVFARSFAQAIKRAEQDRKFWLFPNTYTFMGAQVGATWKYSK